MRRIFVVPLAVLLVTGLAPAWGQTGGGVDPEPEPEPGPGGRADVSVTYDGPTQVLTGERAVFGFTTSNLGPDPAESMSFAVSTPPGLDDVVVTASDPTVSCTWAPNEYYGAPPEADGPSPRSDGGYADCQAGTVAPGSSFSVTLEATRTRARELYLSAWAGTYTGDEIYENNYIDVFLDADKTRPADLALVVDVPGAPSVGDVLTIESTVTNLGPSDATDVRVRLDLPPGLDFVSASDGCEYEDGGDPPPPGAPDAPFWDPRSVDCVVGAIADGSTHTFEVELQRVSGWELWIGAWVEGANYDENYENDYSYAMLPADPSVSSDLSIDSEGPGDKPEVGEAFDIEFTIRNSGPAASGDVTFYDYLPPELEFVSTSEDSCRFDDYSYKEPTPYEGEPGAPAAPGGGGVDGPIYYGGGFLVCDLGLMGNGDQTNFSARFERTSPHEIWHYASVSATNYDPTYENNYTELVLAPDKSVVADLAVTVDAPDDPEVGETFDFNMTVSNLGPAIARDVVLSDFLPEGLDFVSAAPDSCSFSDYDDGAAPPPGESAPYYSYRELRCDLGDLEPGSSVDVTLRVTRTFEWEIWNGAWVTTNSYDPSWENDQAYALIQGENPYADCGEADGGPKDDSVVTDECPVSTGPGADDVSVEAGSGDETREIRTGSGRDAIKVAIRTPSNKRRLIQVWSGGGADVITVNVAPGASNAEVIVHAAGGNDRVFLDVAPTARRLRIVVRGGDGADGITSFRYAGRGQHKGWSVRGGPGADVILGGNSADDLFGDEGRDSIDAGPGNDLLDGGRGADGCLAGAGSDVTRSC